MVLRSYDLFTQLSLSVIIRLLIVKHGSSVFELTAEIYFIVIWVLEGVPVILLFEHCSWIILSRIRGLMISDVLL